MVAETDALFMSQTVQAIKGEETSVTPPETPSATPTRPSSGSVLTIAPDGSTYFADAATGLELVIPPGWLALRIGEQEFYRAWADETVQRLGLANILTVFSGQNPNIARLIALDAQDGHLQNLFPANIILQTKHPYTLEEGVEVQINQHRALFQNVEILSQSQGEIAAGIPSVIAEFSYTGTSIANGEEIRVYEKFILFQANGKVTSLKFEVLDELRPVMTPQFDQIITSLRFYTP